MIVLTQDCGRASVFNNLTLFQFYQRNVLRIISGTARGTRLSAFGGHDIRPTPDRVREAIFSIIFSRMGELAGKNVLDLYAGTGAMGLEAVSRGAAHATLIDRGLQAERTIKNNAAACRLSEHISFLRGDVAALLSRLAETQQFDLIFLDPPYDQGLLSRTLHAIAAGKLLKPQGLICAEGSLRETPDDTMATLIRIDTRRYGQTLVHLYSQGSAEE